MTVPSKAQLLTEVHTLLKRRYKLEPRAARMSVLEAVVYGICHEGTTREQANQALSRFKDDFFDWNEVRVSSVAEIQAILAGLPDPEGRARRIRRFLRQLFTRTYGFSLDSLLKKPQKEAVKELQAFEAGQSDYVVATVVQHALGGHAIPVDAPLRRGLERLGVASAEVDDASLRATLERIVPKNRGNEFVDLMEELAHDTCVEGEPDCPRCELRKICPTGQERLATSRPTPKTTTKVSAKTPAAPAEPAPPTTTTSSSPRKKAALTREGEPPAPARSPKKKSQPPNP